MTFDDSILRFDEKAIYTLRGLYSKMGYCQFKMSKFEEYDLYSKNKDFLVSDGVITFNDIGGKLLALKPDVTLSIIKNSTPNNTSVEKFYYNENVYRVAPGSDTYKEIMQTGIECIGNITDNEVLEVTKLSLSSLKLLSSNYSLHLAHVGLVDAVISNLNISSSDAKEVKTAIIEKSAGRLKELVSDAQFDVLKCFIKNYKTTADTLSELKKIATTGDTENAFNELDSICRELSQNKDSGEVVIDFSIIGQDSYYSGIVFKGFINGVPERVLSGGRYDKLLKRFHKNGGALGFAVYLDALERLEGTDEKQSDYLNIALPKGRLGEKVYAMFESAGFDCPEIKEKGRKLIFENHDKKLRFFWVKPSDVAIYVERGAADIGVAGKDIILEYKPNVYELLDLKVGKCRMAVAAKNDFKDDKTKTLRVATKFSNIAKDYYAKKCRDIDIIHLNGSIEIAPILNLSDVIVDIVETGETLRENNLSPYETIVDISARLISNKASYGFKSEIIEEIKKSLLRKVNSND